MEKMIQIKIAVEGMKAEIIKAFDVRQISEGIRAATEKAVEEFDVENYIRRAVEDVLYQAREKALDELGGEYGSRLAATVEKLLDEKLAKLLPDQN